MTSHHLIGVSVPRSGHHFLVRLLTEALDETFSYCGFYETDCCNQVPCNRSRSSTLFFQKNHDLDLSLPVDLPGKHYCVQYRDPVSEALSDRELLAEVHGEELSKSRDEYLVWIGRKAAYLARFERKWLRMGELPGRTHIFYDDLRDSPGECVGRLLSDLNISISPDKLSNAVAKVAPRGGRHGDRAYKPRSAEDSRFAQWDYLQQFEALLRRDAPSLFRETSPASRGESDSDLESVFDVEGARLDGRLDDAAAGVEALAGRLLDNPHVQFFAGVVESEAGRLEAAEGFFRSVTAFMPDDAKTLRRWSDSLLKLRRLEPARQVAERLATIHHSVAEYRLHLAYMDMLCGDRERSYAGFMKVVLDPETSAADLDAARGYLVAGGWPIEATVAAARSVVSAPWSEAYRSGARDAFRLWEDSVPSS